MNKIKKPELLAPAGNFEKMKTAFAFGADAVYLGIPDFSLRARANDFTEKLIKEAVDYAHSINKKAYITLNIFAHNEHLKKLKPHIKELKKIKPDGLFISDPGLMLEIRKIWPQARIILSTQANCTNFQSAKFWKAQGISRIILARELTFKEIKEIREKVGNLELEVFVHGALCMAYSGRCFLSKFFNYRSANLGDCSQPCRWNYDSRTFIKTKGHEEELELIEEKSGSYILNSQDLCLIKRIKELIDAGISAFKIEGRAKSIYYLGSVVGAYRKAIDITFNPKIKKEQREKQLNYLYKELDKKLFHRGFTEGFMFNKGKTAQNLNNASKKSKWEFCGQILEEKENKIFIKVHNTLKARDKIEIIKPPYDIIKMKIKEMADKKTGKKIKEAHGGSGQTIIIETNKKISKYSLVRRII